MLKTRVITALVLIAVLIPAALYLPDLGWRVLMSAVFAVAAHEWAGLMLVGKNTRLAYALVLFGGLVAVSWVEISPSDDLVLFVSALVLMFWLVLVPICLYRSWVPRNAIGLAVGLLTLIPAWAAVVFLPKPWLLTMMMVAWVADIAAYFVGRRFGRRKLAPTISPGKTWEGATGAVTAVFLYLLCVKPPSSVDIFELLGMFFIATLLTSVCIVGDLFESLLKRQAGIKDSGNILPGHGGVLDRIDSQLALLSVFFFLPYFFMGIFGSK